jgi:aldehyde dehydrogenase (NAD+)
VTTAVEESTGDGVVAPALEVVGSLRDVFATGRTRPLEWRRRQLEGILRLVEREEPAISQALAADLGRSPHEAWFGDVAPTRGEVRYALRHLGRWVRPKRVPAPLAVMPGAARYRYEPLGVVLVIGPWNYPFYLCLAPLVGAVAAGNCVIVKPSENAPASSEAMAVLLPRYLDPEAVRVVEGDASATQGLIDARLDHVFFTGGTEIGRKVMQAAAAHLTPVTLELGGKSPAIVTRNADVEVAARRIAFGKLLNSGQTCIAPDYVLVEEPVKDELVAALARSVQEMRAGEPPLQPIVNGRQFNRLVALLEEKPGQVVVGGGTADNAIEPTIVVDPDPASSLMKQEIFGPVLPVLGVRTLDEAIAFVNSREKPLAAYVFSDNRRDVERVFDEVPAGGATANHTLMHVLAPQLPFGGVGHSGIGAYHGRWGFECFSHRKATLSMKSRPDLKVIYPPYSERAKKLLRRLA